MRMFSRTNMSGNISLHAYVQCGDCHAHVQPYIPYDVVIARARHAHVQHAVRAHVAALRAGDVAHARVRGRVRRRRPPPPRRAVCLI